ncbi:MULTISPECIES: PilN domain-containing protein [Deinococcus]|uniref:Uncharacterized protein n=1 Tax=Deinococcus geothermalis (strain DSM 11300 / CIP 105573 / AG-3a) TaxID=319795 RepID=Q1J098_DEIGD|nr:MULTISPECIES: PilN domain-containing protein [Deinococcus]ABF45086.1 hypothetical protein Dgeo_0784 [Deinococcus geothermalis DSM 11300]MBI0444372.1 hypothetical protein [Deinococcus sp. DB0503]
MRRAPLALLLLAPLLGGCTRTADTFKPRIVITSPDGGGVSRERSFTVRGYVLDDQGVAQITVDGKAIPIQPGSRKIANFAFQTQLTAERGQYTIRARDKAGNESTLVLPVAVDTTPPAVQVTRFERDGNVVRVTGVATDNNRVAQVSVDGNRLNITPGARVEFYAETSGSFADIQVIDGAGNVAKLRAGR